MKAVGKLFSVGLTVLAIGASISACGEAGRLLSDVEMASLVGRQSQSGWCLSCKECAGTTVNCDADNQFCQHQPIGQGCLQTPPNNGLAHVYYMAGDCNAQYGGEVCDMTSPAKPCYCYATLPCACNGSSQGMWCSAQGRT